MSGGGGITYFATLTATLLLLSLPLLSAGCPRRRSSPTAAPWIGGVIRLLTLVLPDFAGKWVEVYANNPFYFFLLAAIIFMFLRLGTRLERTLRDDARADVEAGDRGRAATGARRVMDPDVQEQPRYQRFIQVFEMALPPELGRRAAARRAGGRGLGWQSTPRRALPFLENGTRCASPRQAASRRSHR